MHETPDDWITVSSKASSTPPKPPVYTPTPGAARAELHGAADKIFVTFFDDTPDMPRISARAKVAYVRTRTILVPVGLSVSN